jgi:hypothetical protein
MTPFRFALLLAFCFASVAYAQGGALPPLSPNEMEAVIGEIKAMIKTDESQVHKFPVREATPERIERLYRMPEFLQQPRNIRENGLIFAGRGTQLMFEKPSDVIARMSSWFPNEIAAARATKSIGSIRLWGPFPNWQDEPAAFLTLWNCMPQMAWLNPGQNPFARRRNDGIPFMAIADRSSGQFDFGACVRERSGRRYARTSEDLAIIKNEIREIGDRVTPVLQDKFARFLSTRRCQGTGPDDCVLMLLLWSSLSPADSGLAKAIRMLEPDVAPDSPLPPLQQPIDQYGAHEQEGEPHFDAGLRKAAFLRAKLVSVLYAEKAWPPQALQATLHQVTHLHQMYGASRNFRWSHYEIGYHNPEVNPLFGLSLDAGKTPRAQAAVMTELESLVGDTSCDGLTVWLKDRQALRATFALRHLTDNPPLRCVAPDWNWLRQGESEEARDLRGRYLALLGHIESGVLYETLLSQFTDYGKRCFDEEGEPTPDWLRADCRTWVAEPQTVPFTLKRSRLTLGDEKKFQVTKLLPPGASPSGRQDTATWLANLAPGLNSESRQKMQVLAEDLKRRDGTIHTATWWHHPRHAKSLVELRLYINKEPSHPAWPFTGSRMFLLFDAQTLTLVGVPQRFPGEHDHAEVVHVSDLDDDGSLEVWWAESFRKCHGDDTDLEREIDCSARVADMGEIKGDSLTYFINAPAAGKLASARKTPPARIAPLAALPASILDDQRPCNTVLIGSVLAEKLGVDFRMRVNDGEVIDLVCKTHPLHPEQTIVALFHDLKDKPVGDADLEKKGFVLAVIDIKQRKLISLYRDTIGEDATTRISDFSLHIDTARYNLAPGVRAFGVRMNIGYGPRCAEGGESNYLSLFVEEGKQLKPVLKDLPMSMWSITEGSNGCGYSDTAYTMDSAALTLTVSPSVTNGRHDLEVVAHHQIEQWNAGADAPAKQHTKKQVLGKLHANGNRFYGDSVSVRSLLWP